MKNDDEKQQKRGTSSRSRDKSPETPKRYACEKDSFSSSPPRLSLLDRIERRIFAEARAENRRARACTHAENRFSIRFNFTLTSAQFSLHGYWPFSSASGRLADRNEKRGREREREINIRGRGARIFEARVSQKRGGSSL